MYENAGKNIEGFNLMLIIITEILLLLLEIFFEKP